MLFETSLAQYVTTYLPYVSSTPGFTVDAMSISSPELSVAFGCGHETFTCGKSGVMVIWDGQDICGFSVSGKKMSIKRISYQ